MHTMNTNDPKRKILILFAHPSLERSEVNRPLVQAVSEVNNITVIDLYAEYPDLTIDVEREQTRLLVHDIIIFMHPLYWYSAPSILKEWQDIVLEYNFAYGPESTALYGKLFFNIISAGCSEAAYHTDGYHHFTLLELFRPYEQMSMMCGMIYLPPIALFEARTAVEEGRLDAYVTECIKILKALLDEKLDIKAAQKQPYLNNNLNSIIAVD